MGYSQNFGYRLYYGTTMGPHILGTMGALFHTSDISDLPGMISTTNQKGFDFRFLNGSQPVHAMNPRPCHGWRRIGTALHI